MQNMREREGDTNVKLNRPSHEHSFYIHIFRSINYKNEIKVIRKKVLVFTSKRNIYKKKNIFFVVLFFFNVCFYSMLKYIFPQYTFITSKNKKKGVGE